MSANSTITYFDNSSHLPALKKVTCSIPFNSFHINPDGNIANCCFYWMPTFIGNILDKSLLQIMEDQISRDAKASVQDGTYKFCDSKICPSLIEYLHLNKLTGPLTPIEDLAKIERKKIILFFDYDLSCNLFCASCRNDRILHSLDKAPEKLLKIHAAVVAQMQELLDKGYELTLQITSSGDGFASPFYWNFLKNISASDNFKVRLTTNGTLMTRDKLCLPYAQKIDHIEVSVDAATEATYAKVRRGGNFKSLVSNLNNLDNMVSGNEFAHLKNWKMNFVVQADNYREMADFARWALSYKSLNKVWFLLIYDWGHLPKDTFEQKAVWKVDHPEHDNFLSVLRDPIFDNSRIIIGNAGALRKKALGLS